MTRPATNSDKTLKKGISDQSFISKAHEEYLKLNNQGKKKKKLKKMSKRLKQILHQERFITGQWAEEKAPKHLPWGQSTMESAEDTS